MNNTFLDKAFDAFFRGQPSDSFPGNCYPKRILPPNGYVNPKFYSVSLFSLQLICQPHHVQQRFTELGFMFSELPEGSSSILTQNLVRLGVPTFFVQEQLLRAIAATSPPEDMNLQNLHWPLEAMLFVLPLEFIREYTGGYDMPFLAVGRLSPGDHRVGQYEFKNNEERISLHFPLIGKTGVPADYSGNYATSRSVKDIEAAPFTTINLDTENDVTFAQQNDLTPEKESEINKKMNALAIKILLVMNARPELIEHAGEARPGKHLDNPKKKKVEALWHPNMIGRSYKVVSEKGDGTHESPRTHWRRGHMRNQKFGQGCSQSKLIWIDPVMVNI